MRICCLLLGALLFRWILPPASAAGNDEPQVILPEPAYHFEITGISEPVEHVFTFKNNTKDTLQPAQIQVTPPLVVPNISARVLPGQEGMLRFRLGEPRPLGEYEGLIEVDFKNPAVSNITFEVTGHITPLIEVKPLPAFFIATQRGQAKEASVELINHGKEPLQIEGIDSPSRRFTLHLATNEPGQRYTLSLKLNGEGKAGHMAEPITLHRSNSRQPAFQITANTLIFERVHTFPEEVDFGIIDAERARADQLRGRMPTQVLMVYQEGGTNFQVTAKTDLPFAQIDTQPAKSGKQVQVEIRLKPEHLNPGEFEGHVQLLSNDPEFSELEIPIKGEVRD
jgi:hypothetical protein